MDAIFSASKDALKQIKNKAVNLADTVGGTDLEKKVKAATSNEHYPTPLSQLQDIANATHDYTGFREIMPLVWKRINESPQYWRIIYKTLVLLRELIRFGSERVIDDARDHQFNLRQLTNFSRFEDGKERGNGIREVSTEIIELVNDEQKLRQVREESQRNRSKYTAMGSGGSGGGGYGSSYGGYGNSSYGGNSYDSGPSGKYAGFGGDSYSGGGGGAYDAPSSSSSGRSHQMDDPYAESSSSHKKKHKHKDKHKDKDSEKEKDGKKKKKKHDDKEKERDEEPSASPSSPLDDDAEAEAERKRKKKALKKAKEAAEAAKLSAPKLMEGGKLAPPPGSAASSTAAATVPDLFDPRASSAATSTSDEFAGFTSATPAPSASSSNTLDALFNFDTPSSNPTPATSSGFDAFTSAAPAPAAKPGNAWDAFAGSTASSASSGFDLLSSGGSSASRSQQQSEDVFEAFQSTKQPAAASSTSSTATAAASKPSNSGDAWQNDLVKLDLGSSKPSPAAQGPSVHIAASKGSDPFAHLVQSTPPRPAQQPMAQQGRPGMPAMGMGQMGGMGMGMGRSMGMGPGMGGMPMQGGMGMGAGMGMGGMGGMQGGGGFGFPSKKPSTDIFFS